MSYIFIAHVEEDADIALGIAAGLEQAGFKTWCYEADSIPGPSYLLQTAQAIVDSAAVLVLISPHSLSSRQISREVIRAHESGKDFIPILKDISHIEFQNRQPEWREAIGAAASTSVPQEGVAPIIPRIIDGLKIMGFKPEEKADKAKISQLQRLLSELKPEVATDIEKTPIKEPAKHEPESAAGIAEKPAARKSRKKITAVIAGSAIVIAAIVITLVFMLGRPGSQPEYELEGILFSEDFESGELTSLSKNAMMLPSGGTAVVENKNNNYYLSCTNMLCNGPAFYKTDYLIKTRFSITGNHAIVKLRQSPVIENGKLLLLSYEVNLTPSLCVLQKTSIKTADSEAGSVVTELASGNIAIEPDTWHDLTIICQENRLAVDIDGKRLLGYIDNDKPIEGGSFTIGTTAGTALFDDIEVSELSPDYFLQVSQTSLNVYIPQLRERGVQVIVE
jgi:hypothetical protein